MFLNVLKINNNHIHTMPQKYPEFLAAIDCSYNHITNLNTLPPYLRTLFCYKVII